jgi:hypothetical protein
MPKLFIFILIFILASWVLTPALIKYFLNEYSIGNAGTFGDQFGAINALFTGLGFAGLVYTIYLQQKQFEFQQKEIDKQNEQFNIQNFETTFFKLIDYFKDIKNSIQIFESSFMETTGGDVFTYGTKENITYATGNRFFKVFNERAAAIYNRKLSEMYYPEQDQDIQAHLKIFKEIFEDMIKKHVDEVSYYINFYMHILNYIVEANLSQEQMINYNSVLNGQIMGHESIFIGVFKNICNEIFLMVNYNIKSLEPFQEITTEEKLNSFKTFCDLYNIK